MSRAEDGFTKEMARDTLEYDQKTGVFTWKVRACMSMNAGDIAGGDRKDGYRHIRVKSGRRILSHRVAFIWMTGECPKYVDHINGVRDDNRWCNLRAADARQNCQNASIRKDSKSGVKGVSWNKSNQKWSAYLYIDGRIKYVGHFTDLIGAELAVRKARIELHGEFANHG